MDIKQLCAIGHANVSGISDTSDKRCIGTSSPLDSLRLPEGRIFGKSRVADSEADETRADDTDIEVYKTLLENAIATLSDSDIRTLEDYVNGAELPTPLSDLAYCVCDMDYDPVDDKDILEDALPYLGSDGAEISSLLSDVFATDTEGTSRIDINSRKMEDDLVRIEKNENYDKDKERENPYMVGEDGKYIYVDEESIKDVEEIKDSTIADKVAEQVESAMEEEVGERTLGEVFASALESFAAGDSAPLEEFVNANSVAEVAGVMSGESSETEEESGDAKNEESDDLEDSYNNVEEDPDFKEQDFDVDNFDPEKPADSARLGKVILGGGLTERIRDGIEPMVPMVALIEVKEDDELDECEPYDRAQVSEPPMTRDEYCTMMEGNRDVENMTRQLYPLNVSGCVDPMMCGRYVSVEIEGGKRINLLPIQGSVHELYEECKRCDGNLDDVVNTYSVRVRDCKRVARMMGRKDFISNKYYKRHMSDKEYIE